MLFSVEQAFVGREEIRAPLKTPAWEASGAPIHFLLRWWGEIVEVSTCYVIMSLIIATNLFTLIFQVEI